MIELTPRPGLLKILPYVGGDAIIADRKTVAKLSANENPLGASPNAIAAYRNATNNLHRYPDGQSTALRVAIGNRYALNPKQVICGCGSDELLTLLGRAYAGPGDEIIYSQYSFLLYPIITYAVGATPVIAEESDLRVDVDSILANVTSRTRIIYLANPNNPTGTYLPVEEVIRLRRCLPQSVLLVIDAAYAEYVSCTDYKSGITLVKSGTNTVVTHTFSKIHGLSALRLGWAYGPQSVIDVLNRIRDPFNVSTPAQVAGIAAIEDTTHVEISRTHNNNWRLWLSGKLRSLGLTFTESVTNFILVNFPTTIGHDSVAADTFLREHGLIVRRVESYGLPHSLRLSIGLDADMRFLIKLLKRFLAASDDGKM